MANSQTVVRGGMDGVHRAPALHRIVGAPVLRTVHLSRWGHAKSLKCGADSYDLEGLIPCEIHLVWQLWVEGR